MTSFQTIKFQILAYTRSILSSRPLVVNEEKAKEITARITDFQQSFETIDLHPSRIEEITASDRIEIFRKIDQIGNLFQKHLPLSDALVNLYNTAPYMRDAINRLIEHSEARSLKNLEKLAEGLESCAEETSARIAEEVLKYRNGPLTVERAKEALEIVNKLLSIQNNQLSNAYVQLNHLINLVMHWTNKIHTYPEDFLIELKAMIARIDAALEKISTLLSGEAENLNAAMDLLQLKLEVIRTDEDPLYCQFGNQLILHFRKLNSYTKELQRYLDDEGFPLVIALYNLCHLKKLERQADEMLRQLPEQVSKALKFQRRYIKALRYIDPSGTDPNSLKTIAQHQYTLSHINQLSHHPSYLRTKDFLSKLSSHAKTAATYREAELTAPLPLPIPHWLLNSLEISSLKDFATLDEMMEKQCRLFFDECSHFLGNAESDPDIYRKNPLIPLRRLSMLISSDPENLP